MVGTGIRDRPSLARVRIVRVTMYEIIGARAPAHVTEDNPGTSWPGTSFTFGTAARRRDEFLR